MPAATVAPVASSTSRNAPVDRFVEYVSTASGSAVRNWTAADVVERELRRIGLVKSGDVQTAAAPHPQRLVHRESCAADAKRSPGRSGRSDSQHRVAVKLPQRHRARLAVDGDQVSACDVDVVGESDHDGPTGSCGYRSGPSGVSMPATVERPARGQHH